MQRLACDGDSECFCEYGGGSDIGDAGERVAVSNVVLFCDDVHWQVAASMVERGMVERGRHEQDGDQGTDGILLRCRRRT